MDHKLQYTECPWVGSYPQGVPNNFEIEPKTICDAFYEAAEKWSERTALIFYGEKITFKKLREKIDRFANALVQIGLKKGDRLALLLLNSPEFVIAFYGGIRAGAIITPISPVYVSSEIRHQLEDSGAEIIVCLDMLRGNLEKTGVALKKVILTNICDSLPFYKKFAKRKILEGVQRRMPAESNRIVSKENYLLFKDLLKQFPAVQPDVKVEPDDVATLHYTGGTTGQPKGAMSTHANIILGEKAYHTFYSPKEGRDVYIAYMPFYHAGGQFLAVLSGLIHGTTLVVITTPDVDDILQAINRYNVTFFFGAPAIYETLKNHEKTGTVDWKKFDYVISSADSLHEATAEQWKARTGIPLNDIWGMTEVSAISLGNPPGKIKTGSIGVPMPNTKVAILDPDDDVFVSQGEIGELSINGRQVSPGYWNNPEATKECEAVIDGERWWRSGDLARMDEDGYFYIYDRKRDLIKYKGLRVYAREVEEIIKAHPKVKEVGVVGVKDIKVGEIVKALVVLESDARGNLAETEIIEYCKDKLTRYKIPKIVEFVSEIPKTDIGKVSRRELREIED